MHEYPSSPTHHVHLGWYPYRIGYVNCDLQTCYWSLTNMWWMPQSQTCGECRVLDFLGTLIGHFKDHPSFLNYLHVRYPVKLIREHTTEYSINGFTIRISECKSCPILFGLGSYGFNICILNRIPYGLIYSTQESPHSDHPKSIVASIEEWWGIKRLWPVHHKGSRITLRNLNHNECTRSDTNWKLENVLKTQKLFRPPN